MRRERGEESERMNMQPHAVEKQKEKSIHTVLIDCYLLGNEVQF